MKHFACLFKLLQFARPYRWRLVLGIAIGFFAGLTNPMLMGSVKLVIDTVFPVAGTPTLVEKMQKASAPVLSPGEIKGATNLVAQLQQGATPLAHFLWDQFSASSKQSLTGTNLDLASRKALLSAEVNRLLEGPSLYTPERFAGVDLSRETRKLLARPPAGTNQVLLNRALVEDAFPRDIAHVGRKSLLLQAITRVVSPMLKEIDPRTNRIGTVLAVCTIPLAMLLRGLFTYLNVYLMNWVSIRAISDLRIKLFSHLLSLDAGFFNRVSTGELMSRFNEISYLQNLICSSLVTLIREPITIIGLLVYLLSQQSFLTVVSLAVLPLTLVPFVVYSKKVRKASQGIYAQSSDIGKLLHETFTGYRVVKAYNLEARMGQDFRKSSDITVNLFMRMIRSMELPGPLIEFFAAVGITSLFIYLAFYGRDRTPGDLLAFAGSIFLMYSPIKNLLRLNTQLEQANAAGQFIFHLLDSQSSVVEPAQPKQLKAEGQPIHFDNLTFSYGEKQVLQNIDLTVPPGRMVALVGSSGSGKTTLTNLLLRFYDPQQGAVRIGGMDIREVSTADLRNQIAVVTQEVILFNDTVRNNILLGRAGASEDEIVAAAKHAHAHEFILHKPSGYQTVIGERGVALSGGQRQRLAIARAVLKNAPILILDEATSALDTESERAVQVALDALMRGRTTICIAHRLSTIHHADQIVVMDQGRIVETGRHDELIKRGGVYQKLYEMQFRD